METYYYFKAVVQLQRAYALQAECYNSVGLCKY